MATREDKKTPKRSPLKSSIVLGMVALVFFIFSQTNLPAYFLGVTSSMMSNEELLYEASSVPQTASAGGEVPKILLSEIFPGNDLCEPFIELYNPTDIPANLTGFLIKRLLISGEETTFLSPKRLEGLIINPHGYFLIAKASSTTIADAYWPKSYNLIRQNSGFSLYSPLGEQVDEVSWKIIPAGVSLTRISWSNNDFSFTNSPTPQMTVQSTLSNN